MRGFVINLDNRTDRMDEFTKNNFPFPVERFNAIKDISVHNSIALSHMGVIKDQYEFPFAVFEDDCLLLHPWSVVEQSMSQLPNQWDALWLGATLTQPLTRYSENLFRLKRGYCLHAVIYNSRPMIDYVLNKFNGLRDGTIIDVFYFSTIQEQFNCFITYPMTATQFVSKSDRRPLPTDEPDQWCILDGYNKFTR
jgi:hypothetical protein